MLYIRRGNSTAKVSKNAYETMYKRLGFTVVADESSINEQSAGNLREKNKEAIEEVINSEPEINVDEIPISEMSRQQLVEYAEKHNIDLSGVKNTREARQRVQKARRERNI